MSLRRIPRPARHVVGIVAALTAGTLIQLTRSSRVPVWDVFWAEDGRFFYGDAKARGFSNTVFEQLGSYLQVVPRLLSNITAAVPVKDAAFTNAFLAALTVSLLAVFIYYTTEGVLARPWQRLAAGAVLVANPAAGYEVNAAVNNLHWFFIVAAFWACLSRVTSPTRVSLNVVVITLAALSDPVTGLLLPLVAWRALRGSRSARWTTAGLLVGLALQYWLVLAAHRPRNHAGRDITSIPAAYGLRVATSFLIGDKGLLALTPAHNGWSWLLPTAAILVVGIGAAIALIRAGRHDRARLAAVLAYSVGFYVAVLYTRGGASGYTARPLTLNGSRYTIVALMLLYSALIIAAGIPAAQANAAPRPRHDDPAVLKSKTARLFQWLLPLAACLMITIQLAYNYAPAGPRTAGVGWRAGVASARAGCSARLTGTFPGPESSPVLRPRLINGTVEIPQPPISLSYFWAVRLRCDQLS